MTAQVAIVPHEGVAIVMLEEEEHVAVEGELGALLSHVWRNNCSKNTAAIKANYGLTSLSLMSSSSTQSRHDLSDLLRELISKGVPRRQWLLGLFPRA